MNNLEKICKIIEMEIPDKSDFEIINILENILYEAYYLGGFETYKFENKYVYHTENMVNYTWFDSRLDAICYVFLNILDYEEYDISLQEEHFPRLKSFHEDNISKIKSRLSQ